MQDTHDTVRPLEWQAGALRILDQRKLPGAEDYLSLSTAAAVEDAIRNMAIRGAPAIGIAAAYGVVLAARDAFDRHGGEWRSHVDPALESLAVARPTAVNLRWAVERMRGLFGGIAGNPVEALLGAADEMLEQDLAGNRRMGDLGAERVLSGPHRPETGILTHCNAGSLATGGYGTALGVIRSLYRQGARAPVFASETRPWLQGARLTAWELMRDGIPVTLVADGAAGALMHSGKLGWLVVGADRIAANGDVANKIGTYSLMVLARHHGLRTMVVAPLSTVDRGTATGQQIEIELRGAEELRRFAGQQVAPPETAVLNPVFDVTPASLVDVLVTERGVLEGPEKAGISGLFEGP